MRCKHIKLSRLLLFGLILCWCGGIGYAQSRCAEGYLAEPAILHSAAKHSYLDQIYQGQIILEQEIQDGNSERCWLVYSDRSKNTLYLRKNGPSNGDQLDYMEEVAVKQVDGSWMEVYSPIYDKGGEIKHDFPRGWIPVEKVLLTPNAELNDHSFPKKAMILVSLAGLDVEAINSAQILQKKFYSQPKVSKENFNGKQARKLDIYFILKEWEGAVLLSKSDRLDGSQNERQSTVLGWIPRANITSWDSRVCLEPSIQASVVAEYRDKELPVYDGKEDLLTFLSDQAYVKKNSVFRTYHLNGELPDAYEMRMPILTANEDGTKYVASIARVSDNDDQQRSEAFVKRKIQETKDRLANVNILFVVDGTQSMKNYYPAIASSIQNMIKNNELKKFNNSLRFGMVVYRDYPDGDRKYEITPLTANENDVITKATLTRCFSADRDLPVAQYQGLVRGLKEAGFDSTQSNMVVLIGAAGNHRVDKFASIEVVVNLLREKQCSLVSFQVVNGADESFINFNYDVQDYLRLLGQRYVDDPKRVKLKEIAVDNTYELQIIKESGIGETDYYIVGRFTFVSEGHAADVAILEKNVVEAINQYLDRVDRIRAEMESLTDKGARFEPEFIDLLRQKGFTNDEIGILKQVGDISAKGFTAMRFYGQKEECFVPVVFMSSNEKAQVDEIFKHLIYGDQSTTVTKALFMNAIAKQAMSMTGDERPDVVMNKTLDQIWQSILGIPYTGNLGNTPLRELNKMEDAAFYKFFIAFKRKAVDFIQDPYTKRTLRLAGMTYHWIPLEDFPGS
jgi:hypothetical protein